MGSRTNATTTPAATAARWPTDASLSFKFTAEDTEIDQLVYGKLAVPQVVPWDDVPPGYGRHQIEYRAIDATGNIASCRANAPEPTNLQAPNKVSGPRSGQCAKL